MGEGEMENDRGMALEFERMICIQNLGGKEMLRFIRAGILVCVVMVSVVRVVFFWIMFLVTNVLAPNIGQAKIQ